MNNICVIYEYKGIFLKEKKEKETDVKLKVISLFNIIIKFKLHP